MVKKGTKSTGIKAGTNANREWKHIENCEKAEETHRELCPHLSPY